MIDVAEVANVDDARDDGVGNYLVVDASSMPGTRELRLFSKLTMARTATGSFLGNTTFGRITLDTLGGSNASFATQATSVIPNVFRVPVGGAVVVGTSSFVSSMTDHFPAATYTALRDDTDDPAWIGESDTNGSGPQARRGFMDPITLINDATASYNAVGTDGAAEFMGTFWDPNTRKVHSMRNTTIDILRSNVGPDGTPFVVEERFTCPASTCAPRLAGSNTGSQVSDYAITKQRLYTISGTSPARLVKIRTCATGGPT